MSIAGHWILQDAAHYLSTVTGCVCCGKLLCMVIHGIQTIASVTTVVSQSADSETTPPVNPKAVAVSLSNMHLS